MTPHVCALSDMQRQQPYEELVFGILEEVWGHMSDGKDIDCLQVGAINAAMSSLVKCLNVFPKERTIVQRERAKSSYGVAPYFLSKLAAESPIGAFFPLLFASIVYPAAGLHPKLSRCCCETRLDVTSFPDLCSDVHLAHHGLRQK